MTKPTRWIEVSEAHLEALLQRVEVGALEPGDYETLRAVVESYICVSHVVGEKNATIQRLRRMLFGPRTEKTGDVLGKGKGGQPPGAPSSGPAPPGTPPGPTPSDPAGGQGAAGQGEDPAGATTGDTPKTREGHGRNGVSEYAGAEKIPVPHETLKDGDACPSCRKGKVYLQNMPAVMVRVTGQAALAARIYERERLRCHLCGEVFTAAPPPGVGEEKYDANAGSMIALLKYGSGMPFYRLAQLQQGLGIPLPAATQWEIVEEMAGQISPALQELTRQAAQGEVLHNDDTVMRVLALAGGPSPPGVDPAWKAKAGVDDPDRKGIFTSGIVSLVNGRKIALFYTGHRHAGENLTELLRKRIAGLAPPIQMSDALSRNAPKEFAVLLANCLAHGRRQFVDVAEAFPEECRYVLETLRDIYRHDALAKEQNLTPEARLKLHQEKSAPLMKKLHEWLVAQFLEKKVEPNSGLGKAISYLLKHWEALTLFLLVPNAPLDNNLCERALKRAILHRKNSYFYKTRRGAAVGDLYMSLIHTCRLGNVNPFDYLSALRTHSAALAKNPGAWMPWNYREALPGSAGAMPPAPEAPR